MQQQQHNDILRPINGIGNEVLIENNFGVEPSLDLHTLIEDPDVKHALQEAILN